MRWHLEHDVPVPRVFALLSPGGDVGPTTLTVGAELSTIYGEPVVRLEVDVLWRRPRPWQSEVWWPPKFGENRFEWRRSRGG